MKKEIRTMNEAGTIVQVTVADTERWYTEVDEQNGRVTAYPSVTWITSLYPKGKQYHEWLASTGYNEAEAIKREAGVKGHKVHQLITELLQGKEVKFDGKVKDPETGEEAEIDLEEYIALKSFADWFAIVKPTVVANEYVVINRQHGYAGTVDFVCELQKSVKYGRTLMPAGRWLIDFKTSKSIWSSYLLQPVAYKHCFPEDYIDHLAILQLGIPRQQNGRKQLDGHQLTVVEDDFETFLAVRRIWDQEVSLKSPLAVDLPMEINLGLSAFKAKENPLAQPEPPVKPKRKSKS